MRDNAASGSDTGGEERIKAKGGNSRDGVRPQTQRSPSGARDSSGLDQPAGIKGIKARFEPQPTSRPESVVGAALSGRLPRKDLENEDLSGAEQPQPVRKLPKSKFSLYDQSGDSQPSDNEVSAKAGTKRPTSTQPRQPSIDSIDSRIRRSLSRPTDTEENESASARGVKQPSSSTRKDLDDGVATSGDEASRRPGVKSLRDRYETETPTVPDQTSKKQPSDSGSSGSDVTKPTVKKLPSKFSEIFDKKEPTSGTEASSRVKKPSQQADDQAPSKPKRSGAHDDQDDSPTGTSKDRKSRRDSQEQSPSQSPTRGSTGGKKSARPGVDDQYADDSTYKPKSKYDTDRDNEQSQRVRSVEPSGKTGDSTTGGRSESVPYGKQKFTRPGQEDDISDEADGQSRRPGLKKRDQQQAGSSGASSGKDEPTFNIKNLINKYQAPKSESEDQDSGRPGQQTSQKHSAQKSGDKPRHTSAQRRDSQDVELAEGDDQKGSDQPSKGVKKLLDMFEKKQPTDDERVDQQSSGKPRASSKGGRFGQDDEEFRDRPSGSKDETSRRRRPDGTYEDIPSSEAEGAEGRKRPIDAKKSSRFGDQEIDEDQMRAGQRPGAQDPNRGITKPSRTALAEEYSPEDERRQRSDQAKRDRKGQQDNYDDREDRDGKLGKRSGQPTSQLSSDQDEVSRRSGRSQPSRDTADSEAGKKLPSSGRTGSVSRRGDQQQSDEDQHRVDKKRPSQQQSGSGVKSYPTSTEDEETKARKPKLQSQDQRKSAGDRDQEAGRDSTQRKPYTAKEGDVHDSEEQAGGRKQQSPQQQPKRSVSSRPTDQYDEQSSQQPTSTKRSASSKPIGQQDYDDDQSSRSKAGDKSRPGADSQKDSTRRRPSQQDQYSSEDGYDPVTGAKLKKPSSTQSGRRGDDYDDQQSSPKRATSSRPAGQQEYDDDDGVRPRGSKSAAPKSRTDGLDEGRRTSSGTTGYDRDNAGRRRPSQQDQQYSSEEGAYDPVTGSRLKKQPSSQTNRRGDDDYDSDRIGDLAGSKGSKLPGQKTKTGPLYQPSVILSDTGLQKSSSSVLDKGKVARRRDSAGSGADGATTPIKKSSSEIIIHSQNSSLSALLHIPGFEDRHYGNYDSLIKCSLNVESKDPLVFHVSTANNRKVPFNVRNNNNVYTLEFTYHKVVDFNVSIRNKYIINPFRKQTLKANIEISVANEYDFEILQKDTGHSIPIRVTHRKNHVYDIEFEPSSTTAYVLKARAKNDSDNESVGSHHHTGRAASAGYLGSRKSSLPRGQPRKSSNTNSDNIHLTNSSNASGDVLNDFQTDGGKKSSLSSIEDILEKAKSEIYRKLNDLKPDDDVSVEYEGNN